MTGRALHHVIIHRPRHLIVASTDCTASAAPSSTLSCGVEVVQRFIHSRGHALGRGTSSLLPSLPPPSAQHRLDTLTHLHPHQAPKRDCVDPLKLPVITSSPEAQQAHCISTFPFHCEQCRPTLSSSPVSLVSTSSFLKECQCVTNHTD
jgi:hypothetical protein